MTPAGSCPTTGPGATGYSPRQMCESVPQMLVVVMRTMASVGPHVGRGTSSRWMSRTSLNTAARMVPAICVASLAAVRRHYPLHAREPVRSHPNG